MHTTGTSSTQPRRANKCFKGRQVSRGASKHRWKRTSRRPFFHASARSYINFGKDLPTLEPVSQNHFGPTDASKSHGSHGKHDGSCGEHEYHKTGYPSIALCFWHRQAQPTQKEGKTRQDRAIQNSITIDQDKGNQCNIYTTQDRVGQQKQERKRNS